MPFPEFTLPPGALIRIGSQFGIILSTNGDDWWTKTPATVAMTITYGPGEENGRLLYDAATNLSIRALAAPLCQRLGGCVRLRYDTIDGRQLLALNVGAIRSALAHAALSDLAGPAAVAQ